LPHRDLLGRVTGDGDGVVPFESAHLEVGSEVASEKEVPADHSDIHRHPLAVLEVRRILLEELAELRRDPIGPPRDLTARRQGALSAR
jgi:hypothetical protein